MRSRLSTTTTTTTTTNDELLERRHVSALCTFCCTLKICTFVLSYEGKTSTSMRPEGAASPRTNRVINRRVAHVTTSFKNGFVTTSVVVYRRFVSLLARAPVANASSSSSFALASSSSKDDDHAGPHTTPFAR